MMKMAGTRWTAAKLVPSCAAAVLVDPSPTQVSATRGSRLILNVRAMPVITGTMSPTWEIGCSNPCANEPTCRSRPALGERSEEHTSELQSHSDLVCRLLLEKKKNQGSRWYARAMT